MMTVSQKNQLVRVKTTRAGGLKPCWASKCRQETQRTSLEPFQKESNSRDRRQHLAKHNVEVRREEKYTNLSVPRGQRSCPRRRSGIPGLRVSQLVLG